MNFLNYTTGLLGLEHEATIILRNVGSNSQQNGTPNSIAPISKRNDTCSNTVRTSNLRLHWKGTKILDSIKYSQDSSCVRWLSGEQTSISRTISVLAIRELSWTHQSMWSKFLHLIPHQLYEEKHKATWHSIIHYFVPAKGKNQITMSLSFCYITNTAS